jgi:hypothetical protein
MQLIENSPLSKSVWVTAMTPLKLLPSQKWTLQNMEMEETVETLEGVIVKTTNGVATVMYNRTCNKGE